MQHVAGGLDVDDFGPRRIGKGHGSRHQGHPGAKADTGCRHRMPLLAGTAVADIADRVNRFMGRAARDEDVAAAERSGAALPEKGGDRVDDGIRFAHAPRSGFAAGEISRFRPHHGDTVGDEPGNVAADGGILPHARVHGRRRKHRLVGGKQDRRRQVVRQTSCHAAHDIGCRRRHHDEVGFPRQADMVHAAVAVRREEVLEDRLAGE